MTRFIPSGPIPLWRRTIARAAGAGLLSVAQVSCGGADSEGPSGPGEVTVASVRIAPIDEPLAVGAVHRLQGAALSATGATLDRQLTWQSDNEGVATVSAAGVLTSRAEGTAGIRASAEGKFSTIEVRIVAPIPTILSLEPHQITAGWPGPFTLTITGTGFTPRSSVSWDGIARDTRYASATSLQITVDPVDVRVARSVPVIVDSPGPGGGRATTTFAVNAIPVARVSVQSPWGFAWTWRNHALPLTAIAEDHLGRELVDRLATWSVANPDVAMTVPTGERSVAVYGTIAGETDVEATVDGVRAQRTVRVHETPALEIVYEAGEADDRHLMLWDLTTANAPRRLATPMVAFSPAPSPDGQEIAFAGVEKGEGHDGNVDVIIVTRDGQTRRIASTGAFEADPAWSPDGTRLAFTSDRTNGVLNVFVIELKSGTVTRLTDANPIGGGPGSGMAARFPAWSPDGKRIAYTVQTPTGSQLWVMSATGDNKQQLTNSPDANDLEPMWSPDGSAIAFARVFNTPQSSLVMTVDPDGSNVTNIGGRAVSVAATPAYSPDGRWLTTAQTRGSGMGALYAFSVAENAGPRIVVPVVLGGGRHARWVKRP